MGGAVIKTSPSIFVQDLVLITKPRIIAELLVTTAAAMVVAARGLPALNVVGATLLGGALCAGAAATYNQLFDRDIDRVMQRVAVGGPSAPAVRPISAQALQASIASSATKPRLFNFWATWCGPCHRLFPHLTQLTEDLKETDIQFVAVTNEPFNLTREFVKVRKLKYPIASDIQDLYGRALNVTYIPFAVIVNSDGEIVWSGHSGKLSRKRIENVLEPKI